MTVDTYCDRGSNPLGGSKESVMAPFSFLCAGMETSMHTIKTVVLGVVLYYIMHMALVIAFPSHSVEVERWDKAKMELAEDYVVLQHFINTHERGH